MKIWPLGEVDNLPGIQLLLAQHPVGLDSEAGSELFQLGLSQLGVSEPGSA